MRCPRGRKWESLGGWEGWLGKRCPRGGGRVRKEGISRGGEG